jgi:hypothetical protein
LEEGDGGLAHAHRAPDDMSELNINGEQRVACLGKQGGRLQERGEDGWGTERSKGWVFDRMWHGHGVLAL